jgi:hypothetical protein
LARRTSLRITTHRIQERAWARGIELAIAWWGYAEAVGREVGAGGTGFCNFAAILTGQGDAL